MKKSSLYCRELQNIGKEIESINRDNRGASDERNASKYVARLKGCTDTFEVGVMMNSIVPGGISYKYSLAGNEFTLRHEDERVEPLLYPLFFPYGEKGFHADLRDRFTVSISFNDYLRSRLLIRDEFFDDEQFPNGIPTEPTSPSKRKHVHVIAQQPNRDGSRRLLSTNRFQMLHRAKQYYVVECVSRHEDYSLSFYQNNQKLFFGGKDRQVNETFDEDEDELYDRKQYCDRDKERIAASNSCPTFLAESYTGSARHLKKLAMNAITICSEMDRPHVFITFTCNMR